MLKKILNVIMILVILLPAVNSEVIHNEKMQKNNCYSGEGIYKPYSPGEHQENVFCYLPDQLIVIFNETLFDVEECKTFAGYNFTDIISEINAALIEVPGADPCLMEQIKKELSSFEEVEYVEFNFIDDIVLTEQGNSNIKKSWGQNVTNCPDAWKKTKGNKEVSIAFIDSGVDYHVDFKKPEKEADFIDPEWWQPPDDRAEDVYGHGTKMVGIVFGKHNDIGLDGVAPNCIYYSVRVSKNGSFLRYIDVWRVARGILYAASPLHLNADILCIPISLELKENMCIPVEKACEIARNKYHSVLIASAGNENEKRISFPGKYNTTICVGAINDKNERFFLSSQGDELDVVAPGSEIFTTNLSNSYVCISGTSPATAFVAGIAALYFSAKGVKNPNMEDVENCEKALIESAMEHDLGEPGKDQEFGYGLVDAKLVVTVGRKIVGDFYWKPSSPSSGDLVVFHSTSYDPDGKISIYAWDFNNDGKDDAWGKTVSTVYPKSGKYTCAHWVKSNDGQSLTIKKTIKVTKTKKISRIPSNEKHIQPILLELFFKKFIS